MPSRVTWRIAGCHTSPVVLTRVPLFTHQEPAVRQRDDRLEIGLRRDAFRNTLRGAQRLHSNGCDVQALRTEVTFSHATRVCSRSSMTPTHCLVAGSGASPEILPNLPLPVSCG